MIFWARFNLVITLAVITLGALTRLLDAGLGCPDWPGCYGQWMPPSDPELQQQANLAYPLFPLESIKAWAEMIHRYAASALGLSLLIMAVVCWRKPSLNVHQSLALICLGWVCLQGLFGMLTVTLRIWPPVVTLHLLAGMIMLALCYRQLLNYQASVKATRTPSIRAAFSQPQSLPKSLSNSLPKSLRMPMILLCLLVFVQMMLGAWTSAQYAGLACPDLPLCQGQWWPETVHGPFHAPMVEGQQYLGGLLAMTDRMSIQILHRMGALCVLICALLVCIRLWKQADKRYLIGWLMLPLMLQLGIGIANIYWLLPLPLALLHNTGAALLWLALWHVYFSLLIPTPTLHPTEEVAYEPSHQTLIL